MYKYNDLRTYKMCVDVVIIWNETMHVLQARKHVWNENSIMLFRNLGINRRRVTSYNLLDRSLNGPQSS
jgi:hypothetical protein